MKFPLLNHERILFPLFIAAIFTTPILPQSLPYSDSTDAISKYPVELDRNESLPLNGTWSFQEGTSENQYTPRAELWRPVSVPDSWSQYGAPANGFAWYALDIEVTANESLQTALLLNWIDNSYSLFYNGELIHTQGKPGVNPETTTIFARRVVVPLERIHQGEKTKIRLIFKVSNWDNSPGGMVTPVYFGDYDFLSLENDARIFYIVFLAGMFLMFGINQMIFYAFRKKDLEFLFISIFAMGITAFLILEDDLYYIFTTSPLLYLLWHVIWILVRFAVLWSFLEFLIHFLEFPYKKLVWVARLPIIFITLFILVSHDSTLINRFVPFYNAIVVTIGGLILFVATFRALKPGNIDIRLSIFGSYLFIFTLVFAAFYPADHFVKLISIAIGFALMSVIFSISSGMRYSNTARRLSHLNTELDRMVQEKTRHLGEALQRIQNDLNIARAFQEVFYDTLVTADQKTGFISIPRQGVSGDVVDLTHHGEVERFFIADATGHGIQAALATMIIRLFYDRIKNLHEDPHHILQMLRDMVALEYPELNVHFTCFLLDLNEKTGLARFSTAGHPPQYLIRVDGSTVPMKSKGTLVSRHLNRGFETAELQLQGRERICLFTDGLMDARNDLGEFYGEKRFARKIRDSIHLSAHDQVQFLFQNVLQFTGNRGLEDDTTLWIVQTQTGSDPFTVVSPGTIRF